MHSQCFRLREATSRQIRFLTLQICGKCIGGGVSLWSSPAVPDFLDSGIKLEARLRVGDQMRLRQIRRIFFVELFRLIRVVWPILSGVLFAMVGPGLLIGHIERWRIDDALYFTFVTGLTIGYGDLTPRHVVSRFLAVMIGFSGIVLTGLVAAVSVEALRATARDAGE
jgi:Ion channel